MSFLAKVKNKYSVRASTLLENLQQAVLEANKSLYAKMPTLAKRAMEKSALKELNPSKPIIDAKPRLGGGQLSEDTYFSISWRLTNYFVTLKHKGSPSQPRWVVSHGYPGSGYWDRGNWTDNHFKTAVDALAYISRLTPEKIKTLNPNTTRDPQGWGD